MQFVKDFIAFVVLNFEDLIGQTLEHLWLTLVALFFATSVGLGLGILITRKQVIAKPVIGFVNAIQTIPSVALLGFLLPLLGIGAVPAITALFLYALLPIVRNTFTGIVEVDAAVKEAAFGMGMTDMQVLKKVELPLAMPVIFAGIRTAFVINVGVATLCALIAAGGLGEFIFRGLTTNNSHMILAGAIPAALMALIFDFVLGKIQPHILRLFKPMMLGFVVLSVLVVGSTVTDMFSSKNFKGGFPSEFIERGDGYIGLKEKYNLDMEVVELEVGLMYQAVKNKKVDVISGFSTDGRIDAYNLRTLKDDKQYFPPYHAAPLIRVETMEKFPELRDALALLKNRITDKEMIALNYQVDKEHKNIRQVAVDFLSEKGLKSDKIQTGKPDIIIGSKNFTESFILAEMFKVVVENYTTLTVDLKLGFGGTKLIFDALDNGEIDLYPEYTGTGLLVLLDLDETTRKSIIYSKGEVFGFVQNQFMDRYKLEWLQPLGFNNTFAMMMREKHAKALGVESISDLSKYLQGD